MRVITITVLVALNFVAIAALVAHRRQLKKKLEMRQTITIQDRKMGEAITVVTIAAVIALAVGVAIVASHPLG